MASKPLSKGYKERLQHLMDNEADTMDMVCTHVAQGGTLIDLCEGWDVVYGKIVGWINRDDGRKALYEQSLQDRNEWTKETILSQLREIASADIRKLFDEHGHLKDARDWPDDVAKAIAGMDVFEEFAGKGEDREHIGNTHKIKMNDKLRALELIGKTMAMFQDKVHHTGELTLADLVAMSNQPPKQGDK